jgi:hypothetical protein
MKAKQASAPQVSVQMHACMVCGKPVQAFYGAWGTTGTCSRKCEDTQEARAHDAWKQYDDAREAHNELAT